MTVRGFEIVGCDAAIAITASDALIQNNHLRFSNTGVGIAGMDNVVQNNLIENNLFGVVVQSTSDGTEIKNNTIRQSSVCIDLLDSQGVTVNKNSVQNCAIGINALNTTACTISFNSVSFNETGIGLVNIDTCQISRNVVTRSSPGPDCFWDGNGSNVFSRNTCRTETPPGAWD